MLASKRLRGITFVILLLGSMLMAVSAQADTVKLPNGLDMYYKTAGSGNIPVILIHGYSLSSASWDKVIDYFPAKYKVYAIDLRGFGLTSKPNSGYTYQQLAEDISQFMEVMKIKKAILIGHSMGGMVLQHFAVLYPDKVMKLVLSNTFAMNVAPVGMSKGVEKRINAYGSKEQNRAVFQKAMPRYFSKENLSTGDLERFVVIGLKAKTAALKGMLRTMYTTPAIPADKYASIKAPTLINVTTRDIFGTFKRALAINEGIKNSEIFVVAYSGHTPMWERPRVWLEEVVAFMDK